MGCAAYNERTVYSKNAFKFDLYLELGTSKNKPNMPQHVSLLFEKKYFDRKKLNISHTYSFRMLDVALLELNLRTGCRDGKNLLNRSRRFQNLGM